MDKAALEKELEALDEQLRKGRQELAKLDKAREETLTLVIEIQGAIKHTKSLIAKADVVAKDS